MGVPAVKPTNEEKRRRLNLVERAMQERGWSTGMARALARQMGVTYQTIYRYRAQVLEEIRDSVQYEDRDTARAEFVDKVRRYQISARDGEAWGALSSMLNVEARVLGIEAPQKIQHTVSPDQGIRLTPEDLEWFAHVRERWEDLCERREAGTITEMERNALDVFEAGL